MIKLLVIYIKWAVKYVTIVRKLIKVLFEIAYVPRPSQYFMVVMWYEPSQFRASFSKFGFVIPPYTFHRTRSPATNSLGFIFLLHPLDIFYW